jgi:hypothetical protein
MAFVNSVGHFIALYNNPILQLVTIMVLVFTFLAAWKSAHAAEKLTEATERQIQTATEQARAAKEQVEVARRQITESLRPILLIRNSPVPGREGENAKDLEIVLINEGLGVALDVWWAYGEAKGDPSERHWVDIGIVAPKLERSFRAKDSILVQQGLIVVYESLAGVVSGTRITWTGNEYHTDYSPDVTEWARRLLGKPLRPTTRGADPPRLRQ